MVLGYYFTCQFVNLINLSNKYYVLDEEVGRDSISLYNNNTIRLRYDSIRRHKKEKTEFIIREDNNGMD